MISKKLTLTVQYVLIVCALLLTANMVLGLVMMDRTKTAITSLIRKYMMDMTDTAAGLLDGDALGALTEEDVDGEVFNDISQKLTVFQNHVDIEFIYAVRQVGEGKFVFTVDPDPIDPGEFGEEVLCTPALVSAGNGVSAVDEEAAADRWGNFYSAYSPVFDSKGAVAGIVGIDFDVSWYQDQIRRFLVLVGTMAVCAALIGGFVVVMVTNRIRKKFQVLNRELAELSTSISELSEDIISNPGYSESMNRKNASRDSRNELTVKDGDEIEVLDKQIQSMHEEIRNYIAYIHDKANTDSLTKVQNTNAYHERIREIESDIANQTAAYTLLVFDIDRLKQINDEYGHASGDVVIKYAAKAIVTIFGNEHVYRIGGDEFIAVMPPMEAEEVRKKSAEATELLSSYNSLYEDLHGKLSFSIGTADYQPGQDSCFKDTFIRADEAMYAAKEEHHRNE